jgi:hypothetical protein
MRFTEGSREHKGHKDRAVCRITGFALAQPPTPRGAKIGISNLSDLRFRRLAKLRELSETYPGLVIDRGPVASERNRRAKAQWTRR